MENIHPIFEKIVNRSEKENFLNQKAMVFWLTGLSGSGKSSIAQKVERWLFNRGYLVQIVDGDNIRTGICNNLSFSLEDRVENIRRVAEISKLLVNCGVICINSFVSPTIAIREKAKQIIGEEDYKDIYISTSLQVCEERDVNGLYKKARAGKLADFTGVDSPYEEPKNPDLIIKTENNTVDQSAKLLFDFILKHIK